MLPQCRPDCERGVTKTRQKKTGIRVTVTVFVTCTVVVVVVICDYDLTEALATFFVLGWIILAVLTCLASSNPASLFHSESLVTAVMFTYGIAVTAILARLFWFETSKVFSEEKI